MVASTGSNANPVISNYRKYGFDAVINKPFHIEELSRVLEGLSGQN